MNTKNVSTIMLTLLLTGMLMLAFNVQPVKASGTIYIRPDGTVVGTDKIQRDGDVYTFTDNIYDEIVVEIDNIVVDGAGYTVQGTGEGYGIHLPYRNNVTLRDIEVTNFSYGIRLYSSSNNVLSRNIASNNDYGIILSSCSGNVLSGNNASSNNDYGIVLYASSNNLLSGNTVSDNFEGILIHSSSNNVLSGNTVSSIFLAGIVLYGSRNNALFHNNLIYNQNQVVLDPSEANVWDNGYPSGGNYWSDHVTIDDCCGVNQDEPGSDGIVDEPYVIDDYNRDHYPLVEPWSPVILATIDIDPDSLHLMSQGKWVTCYIELPEGYNVSDIDISTVMLNDTISISLLEVHAPHPTPIEIGDCDNDGVPDLMVKFDRAMVSELLLSERITNGYVTLTITGEVDGAPFEGTDTIRVLMTGGATRGSK